MAQPKVLYRTGGPSALANTSSTGPCFATAYEKQPCGIHGELFRDPAFQKPINPRNEGGDAYRSLNSILVHVVTAVRPIAVTTTMLATPAQPPSPVWPHKSAARPEDCRTELKIFGEVNVVRSLRLQNAMNFTTAGYERPGLLAYSIRPAIARPFQIEGDGAEQSIRSLDLGNVADPTLNTRSTER